MNSYPWRLGRRWMSWRCRSSPRRTGADGRRCTVPACGLVPAWHSRSTPPPSTRLSENNHSPCFGTCVDRKYLKNSQPYARPTSRAAGHKLKHWIMWKRSHSQYLYFNISSSLLHLESHGRARFPRPRIRSPSATPQACKRTISRAPSV